MSNYNFRPLPQSMPTYAGLVSIGAEVINGTGDVQIIIHDRNPEDPDSQTVFLHLNPKQAQDLAESIYHAACDADWAKRTDRCLGDQKAEWRKP